MRDAPLQISDKPDTRRKFLLAALTAPLTAVVAGNTALAQQGTALAHLDATDPQAKGLGYVDNAKSIDPKTESIYKPGAHCGTCLQFKGKSTDGWGPCNIFPGKAVNANGWCRVWVARP